MGTTAAMRAAYVTEPGPAESIQVGELPVPEPGPTDVLVRVEAVAVNPIDTFIRSGAFPTAIPMPFVVGRDAVGTVEAVGDGVSGFRPGERVWSNSLGYGGRQGPTADFAVVPAERLYALPAGVDTDRAVAALQPAATAHIGLFLRAGLRAGETVFVGGGAGNVGTAVTVAAVQAGARVVVSARAEDEQWCRAAGAAGVVDYRAPDLAERVAALAPDGVDLWWESGGYHDLERTAPLVNPGGRIVLAAAKPTDRPPLPVRGLYTRDVSLVGFAITNASADDLARAARAVNRLLAADGLPVRLADVLPLSGTAAAHRRLEDPSDRVRGRLVVRP